MQRADEPRSVERSVPSAGVVQRSVPSAGAVESAADSGQDIEDTAIIRTPEDTATSAPDAGTIQEPAPVDEAMTGSAHDATAAEESTYGAEAIDEAPRNADSTDENDERGLGWLLRTSGLGAATADPESIPVSPAAVEPVSSPAADVPVSGAALGKTDWFMPTLESEAPIPPTGEMVTPAVDEPVSPSLDELGSLRLGAEEPVSSQANSDDRNPSEIDAAELVSSDRDVDELVSSDRDAEIHNDELLSEAKSELEFEFESGPKVPSEPGIPALLQAEAAAETPVVLLAESSTVLNDSPSSPDSTSLEAGPPAAQAADLGEQPVPAAVDGRVSEAPTATADEHGMPPVMSSPAPEASLTPGGATDTTAPDVEASVTPEDPITVEAEIVNEPTDEDAAQSSDDAVIAAEIVIDSEGESSAAETRLPVQVVLDAEIVPDPDEATAEETTPPATDVIDAEIVPEREEVTTPKPPSLLDEADVVSPAPHTPDILLIEDAPSADEPQADTQVDMVATVEAGIPAEHEKPAGAEAVTDAEATADTVTEAGVTVEAVAPTEAVMDAAPADTDALVAADGPAEFEIGAEEASTQGPDPMEAMGTGEPDPEPVQIFTPQTWREPSQQTRTAAAVRAPSVQLPTLSVAPPPEPVTVEPVRRLVDPEQQLSAYAWTVDPGTLREIADDPEPLLSVQDRLTDKLEYAERDAVRARLLSLRAVVGRVLGEYGRALADGREALRHAEASGDVRLVAVVQARVAQVHQWRGDFAEADRLYAEANSVELPDRLRAEMHVNAGRSCYEQGRYLEACNHFELALELRRVEDPDLVRRTEYALDAVMARVQESGWGPYPRASEEILQQSRPPQPTSNYETGYFGYADSNGDVVIAEQYAEVLPFSEGAAWVRKPGADVWELIDETGASLIDDASAYTQVLSFSDGLAWVSRDLDGGWFAIDWHNRVIVPGSFDDVRPFRHGLAPVRRSGWGALDRHGRIVVATQYAGFATALTGGGTIDGFTEEGLAIVDAGGRLGVVDKDGQTLVTPRFARLLIHPAGFVIGTEQEWGALDRLGDPIVDVVYETSAEVAREIDRLSAGTRPVL